MIRIVGLQRSEQIAQEFILLQNQGSMRHNLRGLAIVAEPAFDADNAEAHVLLLKDDVDLMPGQYALVRTCSGTPRWSHTAEGHHIYYAYANRTSPLWSDCPGPIHVLAPQHTYCERLLEPLLV